METFSERLVSALAQAGLSRSDVSKRLGIAASSVTRWVNGDSEPTPKTARELAELLSVAPAWLMTGNAPEFADADGHCAQDSAQASDRVQNPFSVKEDVPPSRLLRRMNHTSYPKPQSEDFQQLFKELLKTDTTRVLLDKAKAILSSGDSERFYLAQMMLEEAQARTESLLNQVEGKSPQ